MNYESRKKYLGIDWGEARIGLALADSETKIATPFKVVGSLSEVLNLITEEKIDVAIVGKPVSIADYKLQIKNDKFNDFLKNLEQRSGVKVELVDERLTSKAADALPGGKKTKASRDAISAMLILQTYLDKL